MRILIDMNLTRDWCDEFKQGGFEAVHWTEVSSRSAPDSEIMAYARDQGFVVFTHDLDFGAILFHSADSKPSVIQLRCQETRPSRIGELVVSALKLAEPNLRTGALVTIDPKGHRIHMLPIRKE